MMSISNPATVLGTVKRLLPDLQTMLPANIVSEISDHLTAAAFAPTQEQKALADRVLDLVAPHVPARQTLQAELTAIAELPNANGWLVDTAMRRVGDCLPSPDGSSTPDWLRVVLTDSLVVAPLSDKERTVVLAEGGIGGARSRKLANFRIVPRKLVNALGGGGVGAIIGPHVLTVAYAVWAVTELLHDATAHDLGEEQATVLWGVLKACDRLGDTVGQSAIVKVTNEERSRFDRAPLAATRVREHIDDLVRQRVITAEQHGAGKPVKYRLIEAVLEQSDSTRAWRVLDRVFRP